MNINVKDPTVFQHELRSPLTTIMGMVAFLNKGPLTAKQRHYVQKISQSAKHLLSIANDLSTCPPHVIPIPLKKIARKASPWVLVVEDNTVIQFIHKTMLTELNCQVDTASTAKEALEKAEKNQYDLILLDIGLPDRSGIEVARELRKRELCKTQTPIIALTAFVENSIRIECLHAGINQILNKPVDMEGLSLILLRL